MSSEERCARRRERLLEAGVELFGTRGYSESSIREICTAAGLNRRYFYESFATREELLRAVYDGIVGELGEAILGEIEHVEGLVAKTQVGMTAFWQVITDDLRKARILTIEVVGVSEELERRRREARHWFADFLAAQGLEIAEASDRTVSIDLTMMARALVAATMDLIVDWMRGDTTLADDELAQHCIDLYTVVGTAVLDADVRRPRIGTRRR